MTDQPRTVPRGPCRADRAARTVPRGPCRADRAARTVPRTMPRSTLRYATEHLAADERARYRQLALTSR